MKNVLITFIFIASFSSSNAYSSEEKTELSCESLGQFYILWSDSCFGNDPTREKSAWIIRNSIGKLQWIRWPSSRKWKKETWKGRVPANLIAQVHTHPLNTDPRPSSKDIVLARTLNKPLYTISRKGIWKVTSDGTITKVAGSNWDNYALRAENKTSTALRTYCSDVNPSTASAGNSTAVFK